jgi:hypothetical protein
MIILFTDRPTWQINQLDDQKSKNVWLPPPRLTHIHTHTLGFVLRASSLLGRHSTTWAMPPALFGFSYFSGKTSSFCLGPGLGHLSSYLRPLLVARIRGKHHQAWLIDWDGILLIFCLGWPRTLIFLISASWVARIQIWTTMPSMTSFCGGSTVTQI